MRAMTVHEERRIREYVNSQSPPEDQVTFVQKVATRKILGRVRELYDVRTATSRWWVITEPTNLYLQDDFQSIDMALTYHLGVTAVLAERSRKQLREPIHEHVVGAWRWFERAVDAYNEADEAEAFQAVGVHCREALLAVIREAARRVRLPEDVQPPQLANFKAWASLLFAGVAQQRARDYLTGLASRTWDLAVWLQHYTDAAPWDAELTLNATGHFLTTYSELMVSLSDERPKRCPSCASYRLEDASHRSDDGEAWISQRACAACDWLSEAVREPWAQATS